ncbi:MAG: putative collagen-binding domain-containing protein, partial [Aureliella sp.]
RGFKVRMNVITGSEVRAWWFSPRNGSATEIGLFDNQGERSFEPPDPGEAVDWVLVLDDATRNYPKPRSR